MIKQLSKGLILVIYFFIISLLIIKSIVYYSNGNLIAAILFAMPIFLSIILLALFYKGWIEPYLDTKTGLWWDTLTLVFGSLFGIIFSEVLVNFLNDAIKSGDSIRITISALTIYGIAFSIVVLSRVIYGWVLVDKLRKK